MVDINLLKDDDDERENKGSNFGGAEFKEDIGDEINFDDDLTEPVLDDDDLLGDVDELTEMDSDEPSFDSEDDYTFVSSGSKKAPLWLWGLLGLVCIAAALYLFVIQPRTKQKPPVTANRPVQKPLITRVQPDSGNSVASQSPDTVRVAASKPIQLPQGAAYETHSLVSAASLASASKAVVNDLTRSGQFATFLLNGDQVYVQYISRTPNVSDAMGHRIQTLLNLTKTTVSPEDRHRTAGIITYWGVISGNLRNASAEISMDDGKNYKTSQAFVTDMVNNIKKYNLTVKDSQNLTNSREASGGRHCVRIEIEGRKEDALAYLEALPRIRGNFGISKLLLAPVSYSDFSAAKVKMVLDFLIQFG